LTKDAAEGLEPGVAHSAVDAGGKAEPVPQRKVEGCVQPEQVRAALEAAHGRPGRQRQRLIQHQLKFAFFAARQVEIETGVLIHHQGERRFIVGSRLDRNGRETERFGGEKQGAVA
jgi:hypothetical protein